MEFEEAFQKCPLVAILRGIRPSEVEDIGEALVQEGFRIIEVPLNSPDPLESIARLRAKLGSRAILGAGTVLSQDAVHSVKQAGGDLIVMPHADLTVIAKAKELNLTCVPGIATPTEAFNALKQGADALKLFPAEAISPAVVKAMRAVLPSGAKLLPVGGITPDGMAGYLAAGANGFGLGGALYAPRFTADDVARRARRFLQTEALMRLCQP
ncbi:2-dehydro-3-deoxy-6-phosphogalactonate aldolase [uncultured Cohaesibacter sp.]|uniref:2-dehydro-3-deoxy-6-phosphogalactonate aldolase n=1 Tax=uncultured Cohaesibacter sp. TaxID=1002546 RepID=UPI00292D5342|nr:2-dehydro-3-deoxy-6-phosphogalactonate aldolase [uncultured Cohaesibacter sp.]